MDRPPRAVRTTVAMSPGLEDVQRTMSAFARLSIERFETIGAVASKRSGNASAPTFPALSVQLPLGAAFAASGPAYVSGGVQPTSPAVASVPLQTILTGWLYQPLASAARSGVAETTGAVASNFNGNVSTADRLPAASLQLPFATALSLSGPSYVDDVQA